MLLSSNALACERVLDVVGMSAEHGNQPILMDVTFSVGKGEVVAIVGPSGSGKTTLLRCLNGLQRTAGGHVEVFGFDIARGLGGGYDSIDALRRDVGFVQQELFLWPHKSVLENLVEAPIRVRAEARDEAITRAIGWLGRLGLEDKVHALPHRLSQGQRQRAAICRALMMEPRLLLLDEVTSALDIEWSTTLGRILRELAAEGRSFLFVTHQLGLASKISDHVLFFDEGRLLESNSTRAFFQQPASNRAIEFLQLSLVDKRSW